MKLCIQIPCFNEGENLQKTLDEIPKKFDGVSEVQIVIIDDGSSDKTAEIASRNNCILVKFPQNRGLVEAFQSGLHTCLNLGADIVVNTDGDGQYAGREIQSLIDPIIGGSADAVVGVRDIQNIAEFTFLKKVFQRLGTFVTNTMLGISVNDVTSGFRAYSAEAATHISLSSKFTYTLESLVQLSESRMSIVSVPITRNAATRESRLFKSNFEYIRKNGLTLIRVWSRYNPFSIFAGISVISFFLAVFSFFPFINSYLNHENNRHLQSLIFGTIFAISSIFSLLLGIVSDSISSLRRESMRQFIQSQRSRR